jgi:two-component system nitrogen regulation sensor histidine kinase NtrY
VLATVPTLLVVIFASLLFQSGVKFWFSGRARRFSKASAEMSANLCRGDQERITRDRAMGGDVVATHQPGSPSTPRLCRQPVRSRLFAELTETAILSVSSRAISRPCPGQSRRAPIEQRSAARATPLSGRRTRRSTVPAIVSRPCQA